MRPGALFFLQFLVISVPGRFGAVFLREYGLSRAQVGATLSLPIVASVALATPVGALVDSLRWGKPAVLAALNVGSVLFFLALAPCGALRGGARVAAAAALYALYRIFRQPVLPVADAYCLEWLVAHGRGRKGEKVRYGEHRLWGAVSFGLCTCAVGVLADRFGWGVTYPFSALVSLLFAACVAVSAWGAGGDGKYGPVPDGADGWEGDVEAVESCSGSSAGPGTSRTEAPLVEEEPAGRGDEVDAGGEGASRGEARQSALGLVLALVCDYRTAAFLFANASVSVGTALVENLVFLYFVEDLKASYSLCGVAAIITVIFEIPLFFCGERVHRLLSRRSMMLVSMLAYVTRVMYYTMVSDARPWLILFAEPLHGVTYSLLQMASVVEMSELAPPHLQVTAQTVMVGSRNFGSLIGTLCGSFIMQHYGSVLAYRLAAGLVTCAAVLYSVSSRQAKDGISSPESGDTGSRPSPTAGPRLESDHDALPIDT